MKIELETFGFLMCGRTLHSRYKLGGRGGNGTGAAIK